MSGAHKHYPTRTHPNGAFAYEVRGISEDSIDDALFGFFDECNIRMRAEYQRHFDG